MNVLLKEREVAFHLGDSGAKVLLAWHEFADAAHAGAEQTDAECVLVEPGEFEALLERCEPALEVAERRRDDTAVILYTSGTTGTPKGAELTHDNLLRNVEVTVGLFGLDERAVTLGALPFFHAFGQTCALNATIAVGGCLTLIPRFDGGKALEILERDRVTVFEGVPTMYAAMLHHPRADETRHLRRWRCASRAAPRCRWRSCARSSRSSAARSSRATGSRRPRRSPRSTAATASASPARSACRSTASRCASSTTTAPRCPRATSARWRSAATTS